ALEGQSARGVEREGRLELHRGERRSLQRPARPRLRLRGLHALHASGLGPRRALGRHRQDRVRPARLTLVGPRSSTIAALVEAELNARGERWEVLDSVSRIHRFGGEWLVEVHLDEPTGKPLLVIDTNTENAVDAAEKVLAFIDGHALA